MKPPTATPRYRGPACLRPVPPLESLPSRTTRRERFVRIAIGYMVEGHSATRALQLAALRVASEEAPQ